MTQPKTANIRLGDLIDTRQSYIAKRQRNEKTREIGRGGAYVVRDNDRHVIYVGATNYSPRDRILWHMHNKSPLGRAIQAAIPTSNEWIIEFHPSKDRAAAFRIERDLIESLRPILNED